MGKFTKIVTGLGITGAALGVVSAIFAGKSEEERIKEAVDEYFDEYDDFDETDDNNSEETT